MAQDHDERCFEQRDEDAEPDKYLYAAGFVESFVKSVLRFAFTNVANAQSLELTKLCQIFREITQSNIADFLGMDSFAVLSSVQSFQEHFRVIGDDPDVATVALLSTSHEPQRSLSPRPASPKQRQQPTTTTKPDRRRSPTPPEERDRDRDRYRKKRRSASPSPAPSSSSSHRRGRGGKMDPFSVLHKIFMELRPRDACLVHKTINQEFKDATGVSLRAATGEDSQRFFLLHTDTFYVPNEPGPARVIYLPLRRELGITAPLPPRPPPASSNSGQQKGSGMSSSGSNKGHYSQQQHERGGSWGTSRAKSAAAATPTPYESFVLARKTAEKEKTERDSDPYGLAKRKYAGDGAGSDASSPKWERYENAPRSRSRSRSMSPRERSPKRSKN